MFLKTTKPILFNFLLLYLFPYYTGFSVSPLFSSCLLVLFPELQEIQPKPCFKLPLQIMEIEDLIQIVIYY